MLETLRQFGSERLAEQPDAPEVLRAHVVAFVDRAIEAGNGLDGPDEAEWAATLDRDTDNLRAAFNGAVASGDTTSALQIVTSVAEYAFRAIRYEFVDWAERALTLPDVEDHPLAPTARAVMAYGAFVRGELDRAVSLAESAVADHARLGVPSTGLPERALGNALFFQGHRDAALTSIAAFVAATTAAGNPARIAHALYMHSVAQTSVNDLTAGSRLAEASWDAAQRSQCPTALAHAHYALGLAAASSDTARALDHLEEACVLADGVGNRWLRSFARTEVHWLRANLDQVDAALEGYREVIETWFRGGEWANQWLSLRQLAGILAAASRDEAAALLFGAVDAAGASYALPLAPGDADAISIERDRLAERLGAEEFATASARGASMREDAAVDFALAAIERFLTGARNESAASLR
jgi:tetratricopeptide (TPR) repeat protein